MSNQTIKKTPLQVAQTSGTSIIQVTFDERGVCSIILNRPEVRNAFNEELIEDLKNAFQAAAAQEDIRVIVLRGNGPVFCAGGDLNWLKKGAQQTYQENLEGTRSLAQMFAILNECPKPVIGAIQGAAIGGGVGLVSICDIAIATNETQFSLSEVKLGIVPACIGPFVVAKIGASHARGLFISAERFQGQRAKEMGLIHEVVPDQGALEKAIEKMISSLLKCAPKAMAVAKQLVLDLTWPERRARLEDPLDSVAKTLADVRLSKEGQEGVHAFLEKRKPEWIKNA